MERWYNHVVTLPGLLCDFSPYLKLVDLLVEEKSVSSLSGKG